MPIWKKFYECSCGTEGIMISYDNPGDKYSLPSVYLAFFKHGLRYDKTVNFREKLRYIYNLFKTGTPFLDEVMLDQEIAKTLANDLFEFSNKNYDNTSVPKKE